MLDDGSKVDLEPFLGPFEFYAESFMILGTERYDHYMPIPFTSIINFATINEVDDLDDFVKIIRYLDSKHVNEVRLAMNRKESGK